MDDEDKQQVLVRATGRVVSADQCGVSLEKRFAFYDQVLYVQQFIGSQLLVFNVGVHCEMWQNAA